MKVNFSDQLFQIALVKKKHLIMISKTLNMIEYLNYVINIILNFEIENMIFWILRMYESWDIADESKHWKNKKKK